MIGHSMGGMIAAKLAAMAPERVASLTLISATAGGWQAVPRTYKALKYAFQVRLCQRTCSGVSSSSLAFASANFQPSFFSGVFICLLPPLSVTIVPFGSFPLPPVFPSLSRLFCQSTETFFKAVFCLHDSFFQTALAPVCYAFRVRLRPS